MEESRSWQPGYSVNIPELDLQHQRLFRTIARLEEAVRSGHGESIIAEVLQDLIQHTISHFAAEEHLLQKHGYPGLEQHRLEHKLLVQKLTKFNLSNLAGRPDVAEHLLIFLNDLWRGHVLKTDQEYAEFLAAREIGASNFQSDDPRALATSDFRMRQKK